MQIAVQYDRVDYDNNKLIEKLSKKSDNCQNFEKLQRLRKVVQAIGLEERLLFGNFYTDP